MKRLAIMVSVGAAVIAGAMSSRAAPPGPAASLTDDWAYYGAQGRAHIAQSGGHVTIEATWTPNPTPGPHYRIDATVVGQAIDGTWRCLVSPCAGRGGKFHAQISPDASQLTVSRTDDPRR